MLKTFIKYSGFAPPGGQSLAVFADLVHRFELVAYFFKALLLFFELCSFKNLFNEVTRACGGVSPLRSAGQYATDDDHEHLMVKVA